jgi:hypothetical protein
MNAVKNPIYLDTIRPKNILIVTMEVFWKAPEVFFPKTPKKAPNFYVIVEGHI